MEIGWQWVERIAIFPIAFSTKSSSSLLDCCGYLGIERCRCFLHQKPLISDYGRTQTECSSVPLLVLLYDALSRWPAPVEASEPFISWTKDRRRSHKPPACFLLQLLLENSNMSSSSVNVDDLLQGWIQKFDENSKHHFWVDTTSSPPRAIWVHPYEDEQFLNVHPEIRKHLHIEHSAQMPMPGGRESENNLAASHDPPRDPFSDPVVGAYDSPPKYPHPQDSHGARALGASNIFGGRAAGPNGEMGLSRRGEADSYYEQSSIFRTVHVDVISRS